MSERPYDEEEEELKDPVVAPVREEDKYQKLMRELQETRARAAESIERGLILREEVKNTIEKS